MRSRSSRPFRRGGAVALLAGSFVVATAAAAQAHALVRSSVPANGTEVARAPHDVVVTFTQPPDPKLSFLHVLDSTGKDVETGPSRAVSGKPLQLEVSLPPNLQNGTYTVTWRAVSKGDGHVTGGFLTFGVAVAPASAGTSRVTTPTTPAPPPLGVAGRWLFYWGLAVLVGSAAFVAIVRREVPPRASWIVGGGWMAAAGGIVAMTFAERSIVGISLGHLLSSAAGHEFVERGVAVLVVGAAVAWFVARPGRPALAGVGITSAGAMLVHVIAGHASESSPTWFNVAVQWCHVLAVAVWIGGLLWLLVSLRGLSAGARWTTVKRYSTMAGLALGVVALTGLSRLLDEVGWPQHWSRLINTSYGITVLVKIGLFVPLIALGARNRYTNVPAVTRASGIGSLARTAGAELLLAALVFGATGVLNELPPSATTAAAGAKPSAPQLVVTGHDFATTTRVRLTITPGTVGNNRFTAHVADFDTGRPVPARSVTLTLSLPSQPNLGEQTLTLRRAGQRDWTGQGTVLSMFGTWSGQFTVQEATGGTTVPLRITPRLPLEHIVTQPGQPGQPALHTISLARGNTVQTYIQPGTVGEDTVHFTFFMPNGNELAIASATGMSVPPGQAVQTMPLIRFDNGHFVANTSLTKGSWRFIIQATTSTGAPITAYFDQTIG